MTDRRKTRSTPPDATRSTAPDEKLRLRLWLRLLRATRRVENDLRERLRTTHAMTMPQFDVLAALYRHGAGLKMSELSRMLMVSNGNVTGIVDRLVSEGLVMRLSIEGDRRATRVKLTGKGTEHFARIAEEHAGWVDEIFSTLEDSEAVMMLAPLERLKRGDEKS